MLEKTNSGGREEFSKWFEKFINREGGFVPDVEKWIVEVDKNHEELRKFLGSEKLSLRTNLKSQQNPVPIKDLYSHIKTIKEYMPMFFKDMKCDEESLCMPTVRYGTHNSIKISKVINDYARGSLGSSGMNVINKTLAELGKLYSKNKTSDMSLDIMMSTTPKAFALLGHYGPDPDSCFRQTSDKTDHKYTLGQTKNSCVISISSESFGNDNLARCFAIWSNDFSQCFLANYYNSPELQEGDAIEAIKNLFREIWSSEVSFGDSTMIFEGPGIFYNPYGRWAVGKGSDSIFRPFVVFPNVNNIRGHRCPVCERTTRTMQDWAPLDGVNVCGRCVGSSTYCARSNEYTRKRTILINSEDALSHYVKSEYIDDYTRCENCESYFDNNLENCPRCLRIQKLQSSQPSSKDLSAKYTLSEHAYKDYLNSPLDVEREIQNQREKLSPELYIETELSKTTKALKSTLDSSKKTFVANKERIIKW